jgi:membrane-bound inhibitor of C-type lysozyme
MIALNLVRSGAVAGCMVLLAGCVGPGTDVTVLPVRIDYQCAQNRVLQVQRAPDARTAAVLIDGKPVILQRADSAAQEKYSNGNLTLYLEGERAILEENSRVLFGPCATGPLPKTERYR